MNGLVPASISYDECSLGDDASVKSYLSLSCTSNLESESNGGRSDMCSSPSFDLLNDLVNVDDFWTELKSKRIDVHSKCDVSFVSVEKFLKTFDVVAEEDEEKEESERKQYLVQFSVLPTCLLYYARHVDESFSFEDLLRSLLRLGHYNGEIVFSKCREHAKSDGENKGGVINNALQKLAGVVKERALMTKLIRPPTTSKVVLFWAQWTLHCAVCMGNLIYMLLFKLYRKSFGAMDDCLPSVVDRRLFGDAVGSNLEVSSLAKFVMTTGSKVQSCRILLYLHYQVLGTGLLDKEFNDLMEYLNGGKSGETFHKKFGLEKKMESGGAVGQFLDGYRDGRLAEAAYNRLEDRYLHVCRDPGMFCVIDCLVFVNVVDLGVKLSCRILQRWVCLRP